VSSLPASAATAVALFAATNIDDLVVLSLLSAAARADGRPRRWQIWAGQYLGFATLVGLSLAAGRGLSLIPPRWLWLLALIPLTVGAVMLAAIRSTHAPDPAPTNDPAAPDVPDLAGGKTSSGPAVPNEGGARPGVPGVVGGEPSAGVAGLSEGESSSGAPGLPGGETSSGAAGLPGEDGSSGAAGRPGEARLPGMAGLTSVTGFTRVLGLSAVAGVAGVATLTVVDGADNLAAYTPVFATASGGRIAVVLVVFAVGVAVWCAAGALLTRHHRITEALGHYSRWILPIAFILIGLYTLHATNAPIHP